MSLTFQLIAIAFTLGSLYFTGRKQIIGPWLGALGFVPWTAFCLTIGAYPMILLNFVITVLNLDIIRRWDREARA